MCQCHTMWQSQGAMQVQVAHNKKIPLGEKKFLHGVPAFFSGGTRGEGGGVGKKIARIFFHPPPSKCNCSVSQARLQVPELLLKPCVGAGMSDKRLFLFGGKQCRLQRQICSWMRCSLILKIPLSIHLGSPQMALF